MNRPPNFTSEFAAELADLSGSFSEIAQALQAIQQMLEQGDEQAKYLLNLLPVPVIVVESPSGDIFYVNQQARAIIADEGLVNLQLDEYRIYSADTGKLCPVEQRPLRRALRGEQVYEDRLEWQVGERMIAIEIWAMPVYDHSDNILFAISVFQDSSQRKQAERHLAATLAQKAELAAAKRIQTGLYPQPAIRLPGFELAACCHSSLAVGGDLYDYYQGETGDWVITLADVMGKGISAALLMASFRATLRVAGAGLAPGAAIAAAAALLTEDLERAESYITAIHARLHPARRRLTYVNAGHGHGFMLRSNGSLEHLGPSSPPISPVFSEIFQSATQTFREHDVLFQPADRLILYSDGLLDCRPELDLTPEKLARLVQDCPSASATVDRLVGLTHRALAPEAPLDDLLDDLTVIVLRCAS